MYCEMCNNDPCACDRDDLNPVDVSAEVWTEIYSDPDYDIDHDCSMN